MPAPDRRESAALISRSLARLQDRFGDRFGEGDKVELWHALEDLRMLADGLVEEPSGVQLATLEGAT
jgi:hypothetical protein